VGYYLSGRGDYYRGDYYRAGGIFSSIGKFLGGVAKVATNILPGPIGAVGRALIQAPSISNDRSAAIARAAETFNRIRGVSPVQGTTIAPMPPIRLPRLPAELPFGGLPGGGAGFGGGGGGGFGRRRKRLNVANPKALRRALRRVAGFGKLARRAKRDVARAATAIGVQRTVRKSAFGKKR